MMLLFGLLGVLVGAFLNWVADYALPSRRARLAPSCPYCDMPRPFWSWISLLAFLRWQPNCPACAAPISFRHPLLEMGMALLFAFLWAWFGVSPALLAYSTYSSVLIVLAIVDAEHRRLPRSLVYTGIAFALAGSVAFPALLPWHAALLGGMVGFALLFLIYLGGRLFSRAVRNLDDGATGVAAFGFGDVLLGALVGLMLGAPRVVVAILLAVLLAGAGAVIYLLARLVSGRPYSRFTAIPFAPFLVLASLIALFFSAVATHWLLPA